MTVCSCQVTYAFQSESILYSCINVKELLAWNMREIWSLSNCTWTRTHNHLVRKRPLNHLAKLTKWLSWFVSTYLYGAFDCKYSQLSSIIWLVWANGWVFVHGLSGSGFESSCSHLYNANIIYIMQNSLEMFFIC